MRASRLRRLLILLVSGVLVAGCTASGEGAAPSTTDAPTSTENQDPGPDGEPTTTTTGDEPSSTTEPDGGSTTTTGDPAPTEPPAVGTCWTPTSEEEIQQISFVGEEVDCGEPHGGITVGVEQVDGPSSEDIDPDVLDGDPSDPDISDAVQRVGSTGCRDSWIAAEAEATFDPGSALVVSAMRATKLGRTFWLPTGDEWSAGARWIRCDLQTTDGSEFETPDLAAIGDGVPADLVLCLDRTSGRGREVACDTPAATWQAIASFQIPGSAAPEDAAAYRELLTTTLPPVCADLTEVAVGDPGQRAYRIFAEPDFTLSDGQFTCAARVQGPVDRPLGT